jgi:hypothetical protein
MDYGERQDRRTAKSQRTNTGVEISRPARGGGSARIALASV